MGSAGRPVVVVGAGIAGLWVARSLADRGVGVLVLARDGGATSAGAGIASAQFWDPRLAARARRGAELLASRVTTTRHGMAQIAISEPAAAAVRRIPGSETGFPSPFRRALRLDFLRRVVAVAWSPAAFSVENGVLRRTLARGLDLRRVEVRNVGPDRVLLARGVLRAAAVVVAAGAWSRTLVPDLPYSPRSAQTARVALRLPGMFHVLDTGLYGRPAGDGAVVGDGDAPLDGVPPAAARAGAGFATAARGMLASMFRSVGAARPLWSGPVAFPRGALPVSRPVGGVHVLAGFAGDGLVLAPAYAEELAERLAGEVTGLRARGR